MAKSKNFDKIKTNSVYEVIEQSTGSKRTHTTASAQEATERKAKLQTQGRKGCKATRINMAFTPDNHEYIKTMSKISGMSMTEYINMIIAEYRENNITLFEQAQALLNKTKRK